MKKGYLGIDIGSISTKAVLLDEDDNIISSCYLWTEGSPINAVKNVLKEILKDSKDIKIVGVGTTGSARRLIGSILNANVIKMKSQLTLLVQVTIIKMFELLLK